MCVFLSGPRANYLLQAILKRDVNVNWKASLLVHNYAFGDFFTRFPGILKVRC